MPRKPQFGRIFQRKWKKSDGTVAESPTWWIEYYENGHQRRETSGSNNYKDAVALLKTKHAEIALGRVARVGAERVKISTLLDLVLDDYKINGKSFQWATYVDGHLRPFFGQMKARALGTQVQHRYAAHRRGEGVLNSTINRELALLRRAFHLGKYSDPPLVSSVPRFIKFSEKNNIRKGYFEHKDFVAVRSELPEHLRALITFAYATGCRKGEILALRWTQVDLATRIVRLEPGETKNKEARTIPLIEDVHQMLIMEKQKHDLLFPSCPFVFSHAGKGIRSFRRAWIEACRRAGRIDENGKAMRLFHDLRRTGVRNLVRAGVPERVAMTISGHKTRSVFDRYNIVDERDLRGLFIENGGRPESLN